MTSQTITATASGTWTLGDLTVNRIGFGTMRLPQSGAAFAVDAASSDRARAIGVLRRAESDEVLAVARAHGVSAVQIRLAWTLHQGPHVLAIPGTGNPDHLEANIAAGAITLSETELAALNAHHRKGLENVS